MKTIAILAAVLGLAGCGTEGTEMATTPLASDLVGSWSVVSTAIGSYPGGSVLTFNGDGSWNQATSGALRGGTWTADAAEVTIVLSGVAPAVVAYAVRPCAQGQCLDLAYAGGSTWARQ